MNHRIATLLAIALLLFGSSVRAQDDTPVVQDPQRVAELISQLSHEKYSVREDASNQLIQLGVGIVPEMLDACASENSETAWRALQILEQVGLEGDVSDAKLVIRGLISVGSQGRSHLLSRVQKFAERYQEYKSEVAIQKIRAMGGQVNETPNYGVAQAGVRFIGPFDGGRMIIRAPRDVDARVIEKIRVLEAIKAEEPKVRPREEAQPQKPKEPDANGRDDRDGDCNSFDDQEDQDERQVEQPRQVQQVEATFELDVAPDAVAEDADAVEAQEIILPDLDAILLDLDSTQTSQVYRSITIDENWTGGAEGLSYLSEVHNLNYVQLQGVQLTPAVFEQLGKIKTLNQLGIDQCSFSVADMQRFAAAHSELYLRVTGKGVLGVMPTQETSPEQDGCELGQVLEGSPAFKAGLRPYDKVIGVDEHKVVDFPTLTYTVAGRDVGDEVKVRLLRNGEELEFKIKLGPRGAILP